MRLTTVILLASLLQVSATTFGQRITLNQEDIPLESVLKEIRKQSGYDIYYDSKVIPKNQKVNVALNNTTLEVALSTIFKGLKLGFYIEGNIVSIKKVDQSFFPDPPAGVFAVIDVEGRIVDEDGKILSGATVKVKGTNRSTSTDNKGIFNLKNIDENAVLQIIYIGYVTQEIKVSPNLGDIKMELSVADLNELTISTGYQLIKPEQSTGSISTIREKEYNNRINTTDFLTGLQNKIPGLLVNNDIKFEGNSLFQIRGISTINGNRNPLIVIDGYPTELSLDMIDPNEIESVTVLKDAAAATIYGARSSNGVIIIERKKAKAGDIKVNFRATTGFTPKEDYDRYRWDKDASKIVVEFEKIKNFNASPTLWGRQETPSGYFNYSPVALIMNHWRSATDPITEGERDRQLANIGAYNNAGDYSRLFLRTASTQTNNLDISGGTDRLLYYLTANYSHNNASQVKNNDGIFRLSGRVNMKLSERFSLELNTDYQDSKDNVVPVPDFSKIMPYEHFEDASGNPASLYNGSKVPPVYNAYIMSLGLLDNQYYPLQDLNEVSDKAHTINNRMVANFKYKIGNGFNLTFGGVYETSRTNNRHLASENSTEVRQLVNYYTKPATSGGLIYNMPKGAILKEQQVNSQGFTLRAQANYDKQIATDHSLNLILGAEVRKIEGKSNMATYFGYNDQTLINQPVDFNTFSTNYSPTYAYSNGGFSYAGLFNNGYSDDRFISGYSNLVYAYKDKYSVTGSIRVDQSNLFGTDPKYKYKPLWSVGAAWNIDKENVMQEVSWIRSLKLRAAYGFNGNVAKNALPQVIAKDDRSYFDPYLYTPSLTLLSYANSGLRWEQTRNFNVGLNYQLFKGISGSIDYYIKKSTDVLATNQIDASKGGYSALINQASIRNNGLEVSLQADWISRRRFNWNTGLIFARNTSKVLQVYNANITSTSFSRAYVDGSYSNYLKGYAVGALFNYRYAGLNNTGIPQLYDQNGDVKLYTNEGRSDVVYSGSSIPVNNLGLSNRVDIGNFYVYCMINYYGGFKVRVPVPNASDIRPLEGAGNYWKQAGDEKDPNILPSVTSLNLRYYQDYFFLSKSDKYTVNGSYFTLGDLTFSYSFRDKGFLKKMKINNLEIRAQASNICTIALNKYNYSVATGNYAKTYMTPTYTAALSINF